MAEGPRPGLEPANQRGSMGDQLQRSDLSLKRLSDRSIAEEYTQIEGDEQRGVDAHQEDRAHQFQ